MFKQLRRILIVALAIAAFVFALVEVRSQLGADTWISGYVLLIGVLFLASYNLRKKLSFLPLGRSSAWLQLHIYVGWFTVACLGLHVNWRWPNGVFESALFWVFVFTATSGMYGLFLSKSVPLRLSRLREEVIYERIPSMREQVQQAAHEIVTDLLQTSDAPPLVDFYSGSLIPFFVQRRGLAYYVQPSSHLRNQLQQRLASLERYLADDQRATQRQLARLIDRRDDLDFHDAHQKRLKYWLFFHIAATYLLLVMAVVHLVLVHAFWGGRL